MRHIPNRHRGRPNASLGGEKLWRDATTRVVIPGQKDIVWRSHAPARRGYSEAGLDKMLDQVADHLEKRFPTIEFRVVELAPNRVNFIYAGRKESMTTNLNGCPEIARSPKVAEIVCAVQGHKLSVYQNGMTHGPQGPQMNTINFCSTCGLSLAEVRGTLDEKIDAAVQEGIQKRLAAAAAAGAPGKPLQAVAPIRPDSISPNLVPGLRPDSAPPVADSDSPS